MDDTPCCELDHAKRTFLKRLAMTAAFSVPIVQSFSMSEVSAQGQSPPELGRPPAVSPVRP